MRWVIPWGAICHLPHGMCMSILLPYVLEYNESENGTRIGELLLPLAGPEVYAATPQSRRASRAVQIILLLRDNLYQRCRLPRTLQETGKVMQDQLPAIADMAITDGSIIFNPKESDRAELLAVLVKAWGVVLEPAAPIALDAPAAPIAALPLPAPMAVVTPSP